MRHYYSNRAVRKTDLALKKKSPNYYISKTLKSSFNMSSLPMSKEQFHKLGLRLLDDCSKYLDRLDDVAITPATNSFTGSSDVSYEHQTLPETGEEEDAFNILPALFRHCCAVNGRFFGFVTGSGIPIGALTDFVISVINQNVIAPFVAPAAVTIERTVVRWLAELIGCPGYSGSLTSGGSASNIMGLAMAREAKIPSNDLGIRRHDIVVYASKEIHMSTQKAVSLLGLGRRNLRLLDVDDCYRVRGHTVAKAIAEDRQAGRMPIAIVASAGSTRTGAIDAINEIADIAEKEGLWLHIDGAYGAFAASVIPEKFEGLDRADSISVDPHKWLYQSIDCSCILMKRRQDAVRAFSYFDDYAKSPAKASVSANNENASMASAAFYEESIELTRRFRALKIWMALRYYGAQKFRNAIRTNIQQALLLEQLVTEHTDLELMAPVDLSVVCFRVIRMGKHIIADSNLNDVNSAILNKIISRGYVYLSKVLINGEVALRACITNHLTTTNDIHAVIAEVTEVAKEMALTSHKGDICTELLECN